MANSRIMLTCKHCGESISIGKGNFGSYHTINENLFEQLNDFYAKHERGSCTGTLAGTNCSDDAKVHFVIVEDGEESKASSIKPDLFDTVRAATRIDTSMKIFGEIKKIIDNHYNKYIFGSSDLTDEEKEAVMDFSGDVTYDIDELERKYTDEQR